MQKTINKSYSEYNEAFRPAVILIVILSLIMTSITPVFADDSEPDPPIINEEITITLDGMGGTVSPSSITVTAGGIYGELPTPTKANYDFKGWYADSAFNEKNIITEGKEVTEPIPEVLYAKWEIKKYIITLDPSGGTLTDTKITVKYGKKYTSLPVPTRKGLVFMGWYTTKSGTKCVKQSDTVCLQKNIKLYAKWAPIWYLQTDRAWGKTWYRVRRENSTIASAGCGPSTMAMVVASLKNTNVTPKTACNWSKKKKYKAYLSGTKDGFFKAYGKKYKIKVKQIYYGDLRYTKKKKANKYHSAAKKAVQDGNWVIVLAGKGKWTRGSGHFILWYKTEGNYACIRDANSTNPDRARAKVSTLQKQAKRYWIITVPASKKVN